MEVKGKRAKRGAVPQTGPARAVIELNPHRQVGGAFIPGLSEYPGHWESTLEYKAVVLLALCEDVKSLAMQPTTETIAIGDTITSKYTPDIRFAYKLGTGVETAYIEVKPLFKLIADKFIDRALAITQHFRDTGKPIYFLTDDQLQQSPRWLSALLLFRYRVAPDLANEYALLASSLANGPRPINALIQEHPHISLQIVYGLIATFRLAIDWTVPLSRDALVCLPGNPYRNLTHADIRDSGRFCSVVEGISMGHRPTHQQLLEIEASRRQTRGNSSGFDFVGGVPKPRLSRHIVHARSAAG